ncbi:hypothetical protein BaRGS_00030584, partial [Batillaria attramentaria]
GGQGLGAAVAQLLVQAWNYNGNHNNGDCALSMISASTGNNRNKHLVQQGGRSCVPTGQKYTLHSTERTGHGQHGSRAELAIRNSPESSPRQSLAADSYRFSARGERADLVQRGKRVAVTYEPPCGGRGGRDVIAPPAMTSADGNQWIKRRARMATFEE